MIAERRVRFTPRRGASRTVSIRFGQPVRCPQPRRGDPWWCPVEIKGLGNQGLRPIAGEDSLQALVLALEVVTQILPYEAERAGGHLEWLGERERLVFANSLLAGMASAALQNTVEGLARAVEALENGGRPRSKAASGLVRRLKALIASGGYTDDPRAIPSNKALERAGSAGRSAPRR